MRKRATRKNLRPREIKEVGKKKVRQDASPTHHLDERESP